MKHGGIHPPYEGGSQNHSGLDLSSEFPVSRAAPSRRHIWLICMSIPFCVALAVRPLPGQAADPPRPISPHEQQKLGARAWELFQTGQRAYQQGDLANAVARTRESLQIREQLYPKDRYPQGHADLAHALNAMGSIVEDQGYYVDARGFYERAVAMCELLYPKDRYPQGHPDLATSLNNLGVSLRRQGSSVEARRYCERALAMRQSLYPKDRYPQGHPDLAASLNNLGVLLEAQSLYGEAREYHQRALAMRQSLYPKDRYPDGHPDLAGGLTNLG